MEIDHVIGAGMTIWWRKHETIWSVVLREKKISVCRLPGFRGPIARIPGCLASPRHAILG